MPHRAFCFLMLCLVGCGGGTEESTRNPSITNSIGMKMVEIAPGSFTMGSPEGEPGRDGKGREKQRTVEIKEGFYISSTEVTQAQWSAIMKDNPSYAGPQPAGPEHGEYPVNRVSYEDAVDFCLLLGEEEGKTYRLPTSVEWEYACRAGSRTAYSFGDKREDLPRYGCNGKDSADACGSYKPNAWGLYDMHGNVWEWCSDMLRPADGSEPNPDAAVRALRGGSYNENPSACRSAKLDYWGQKNRKPSVGFRVVLEK